MTAPTGSLEADDGVRVVVDDAGSLRIGWGAHGDWFGPATLRDLPGVAADLYVEGEPGEGSFPVLVLEATEDLGGIATGRFAEPSVGWAFRPDLRAAGGVPDGTRAFGFQYTEFGLPVRSDASMSRFPLLPFRPNVVEPLALVAPDGRTLLLAPLDAFHEQVIAVPSTAHGTDPAAPATTWGWHGDLDRVPAGFLTRLAVLAAESPRAALDRLGWLLQGLYGTRRPARDADALGRTLSYWTDNGAAYWYRTEPGHDVTSTIAATVDDLHQRGIPVGPVQLDSWLYPHEVLRPFDTEEWVVPPTGLLRWEPREDVLPEGLGPLRERLGDAPLVAHCRHLSSSSPYLEQHECWVDGDRAHPVDAGLYERWLDQCTAWGVETFEHDWLIECFLGVRGLREQPGRAQAWQEDVDAAAAERGRTLQWCMASPADILQTVTLSQVTSIRTSGDHGYLVGPGFLWTWFLVVNALARPLGLRPYKDVFLADVGDPKAHSEVEALLSALSTGPVGLGDPLGRADAAVVRRTCRADGALVRPEVPIAATSTAFTQNPVSRPVPLVGEAWTEHRAGVWAYVVALGCHDDGEAVAATITPDELGGSAPVVPAIRWDWRARTATLLPLGEGWDVAVEPLGWRLDVLAPVLTCGLALIGDPSLYATAGDARLADVDDLGDRVRCRVLGAGEVVEVVGWSRAAPTARTWTAAGGWAEAEVAWADDVWSVQVAVDGTGSTDLEVVAAA